MLFAPPPDSPQGYTSPFSDDFFAKHQFHTSADCPLLAERGGLSTSWSFIGHFCSTPPKIGSYTGFVGEALPHTFFGVEARDLTPEWRFFPRYHAASHKWQTLKWITEITTYAQRGELNGR